MRSQLGPNTEEISEPDESPLVGLVKKGTKVTKSKGYLDSDEIDYIYLLNKALPPAIRVVAWSAVDPKFDARHSCISRSYRYYFFSEGYDTEKLRFLCKKFIGLHNFINFAKRDVLISSYWRRLYEFELVEVSSAEHRATGICYFFIRSNAFVHHQIRYMVSLLFEIGSGRLEESALEKYLHTQEAIRDKEFCLASPDNLCFWGCAYEPEYKLSWNYSFKGRNLPTSATESAFPVRSEKNGPSCVAMVTPDRFVQNSIDTGFVSLVKSTLIKAALLSEMDRAIKSAELEYLQEPQKKSHS